MIAADWIVPAVAVQRFAELLYSRRNERRLRARGGIEVGAEHYPLFIALHTAWLIAVLVGAHFLTRLFDPTLLGVFLILQLARIWVITTLGDFWTTRILTLPGAPLIRRGPYRFLRHPNYVIVALEVAILPTMFGLYWIAFTFTALNLALLRHRIRVENHALAERRHLDKETRLGNV
ncbi:MAG: hypothetical protein EXQ91_08360 [Alphaproteobacteria bacterium]|nr:hypothetical protein [Alphaproteobacteria bacterium]